MNELDVVERFRQDVPAPSTDAWLRARAAIASARDNEATEASCASRRRTRPPGRTTAVVAGAAVAAAVIVAGVLLTAPAASPPTTRSTHGSGVSASPGEAAVRARVVDALTADSDTVLYAQSSSQVPGQATLDNEEWDYPWNGQPGQVVHQAGSATVASVVQRQWSLSFTVPSANSTGTSAPSDSLGEACDVSAQRLDVDYTDRTWQSSEQSCVNLTPGLNAPVAFVDAKTGQLVSNIKTLLEDGSSLQVVGLQSVGGERTFELQAKAPNSVTTLELWVDADTYLPVQSVTTSPAGIPRSTETTVTQYSFLPPSQSNLANLTVTVPPGFTQSSSSQRG